MKKLLALFIFVGIIAAVAGCGVKSDLDSAGGGYPRNYPVY
ncbi:MAG: lipoprotein [Rickettsiales bacterium]|nr:lipoprotein [Rickettsiales bacterium]